MKTDDLYEEDYRSLPFLKRVYWCYLWNTWAVVTWLGHVTHNPHWWNGGRRTDGDPIVCERCHWVGRVRDAVHGYRSDGMGDVEGCSECPKCGADL